MQTMYRNEKKIYIPGPQGRLEAQIAGFDFDLNNERGHTPKALAIVCHPHPLYQGTMHNKVVTAIIRAWRALSLATIRFNFRGVGESDGEYGNEIGEVEDLRYVIQWASDFFATKNLKIPLWLAGFSFGALISAAIAADIPNQRQFLKLFLKLELLLSIAPVITHFQLLGDARPYCPWIIITGEDGELINYHRMIDWVSLSQKNNKNQNIKLIGIPEASHFFHGKLVELEKQITENTCSFLNSH